MQGHVDTTNCTTYQSQAQIWTSNVEIAAALYAQYESAMGEAVAAQDGDFDPGVLFGRAYGIGGVLNAHLEKAFGLSDADCGSFWDMMMVGFEVGDAIERLQSDHDYRDHRNTIASVQFAMAGR